MTINVDQKEDYRTKLAKKLLPYTLPSKPLDNFGVTGKLDPRTTKPLDRSNIELDLSATNQYSNTTDKPKEKEGETIYEAQRPRSLSNVLKNLTIAGTIAGETALIAKQAKTQQSRRITPINAPQIFIRPVQDVPAEILSKRLNDIDRIKSGYSGSDAGLKLVAQQATGAQKSAMKDTIGAERAAFVAGERERVAKEQADQQRISADTANTNAARQQELDDYKLQSRLNSQDQYRRLISDVGKQTLDNLETSEFYNEKANLAQKTNIHNSNQSKIDWLNKQIELEYAVNKGVNQGLIDHYKSQIQTILDQMDTNNTQPVNYLSQLKGIASNKKGGKLIARN